MANWCLINLGFRISVDTVFKTWISKFEARKDQFNGSNSFKIDNLSNYQGDFGMYFFYLSVNIQENQVTILNENFNALHLIIV